MSSIAILGWGAVSPAGWGVGAFHEALARGVPLPVSRLARPADLEAVPVRVVPPPPSRPSFLAHARLRRASPISHYTVGAALEALGPDAPRVSTGELRLGAILCVMCGCVNYSRRFYDETLKDPATASPLVFPETVFNAPASHLAALLGNKAINYTLVGDEGAFPLGLALGAEWIVSGKVDRCIVAGAEEMDWLTATAGRLFEPELVLAEGAGAVYLGSRPAGEQARSPGGVEVLLEAVSEPQLFTSRKSPGEALARCRAQMGPSRAGELLMHNFGVWKNPVLKAKATWDSWPGPKCSPNQVLGQAFMASAAWLCVAAADALSRNECPSATIAILGSNEQAIAARFARTDVPVSGRAKR